MRSKYFETVIEICHVTYWAIIYTSSTHNKLVMNPELFLKRHLALYGGVDESIFLELL